ncbi:hypothetical protein BKA82DRAFT_992463 [Pisolithus tinctorius]|uniref:Uncharacterized protein n=1 Tax=Pisolithus tinctorius Marx 270 TaxID=870435 RepID=A0A0C3JYI3_PISTI|nr:hypothetical protein BKA82DRAFT_992463 [Pisolithus tinctorius]KIO14203.1 hypothetical protein M404DRAFT_992463 [Pisolithus tinctorius Marx 270]
MDHSPDYHPSPHHTLVSHPPPFSRNHAHPSRSINHSLGSQWVSAGLYTLDHPDASNSELPPPSTTPNASPSPRPLSSATSPSISKPDHFKSDEETVSSDCFVMEFSGSGSASASSALAPPTEVPLRATQASKAMRKMMGVFRLNPFSMHDSSCQSATTWTGEEAGPLEEEPQMFEFQLHIPGCEDSPTESDTLAPPSLHNMPENDVDNSAASTGWAEGNDASLSHYSSNTLSQPSWFGSDSPQSHTLPSLRPYSPHHIPHSPSLSSSSSRRTPLDMAVSEYPSAYGLSASVNCASSVDNLPSISSMARRWSNPTNIQAPFML